MPTPITQAIIDAGGGTIPLNPSTSYILMEDISMNAPFSSVGANVIFDGSGHTITMYAALPFQGLFSVAVTVSNLGILPSTSTLAPNVGWFFAEYVINGSATNCYSTGPIDNMNCGGIFGANSTGTATYCYSNGTQGIPGITFYCGGICGRYFLGNISYCYSIGRIAQSGGGIVGANYLGGTITNCFSIGPINYGSGGILGEASLGTAINCYSNGQQLQNYAGGIFGYGVGISVPTTVSAIHCYTAEPASAFGGAYFGGDSGPYAFDISCANSAGWNYTISNTALTGYPGDPINPQVWVMTNYPIDNRPYIFVNPPIPPVPSIPCFVAGIHIMTANGYKAVEDLTLEDRIVTADGRPLPFNLYTTVVNCTTVETAPYKISKGAFGRNSPPQDIILSPQHAIQSSNSTWQIPKYAATRFEGIKQICMGEKVQYYHIEMPNFITDNIIANGSIVESYAAKQIKYGTKVYKFSSAINGFIRISEGMKYTIKSTKH
jgi:hypothetical protein